MDTTTNQPLIEMTFEERLDFVANATNHERAAMLHYLGGYTPQGFEGAARMVERSRLDAEQHAPVTP